MWSELQQTIENAPPFPPSTLIQLPYPKTQINSYAFFQFSLFFFFTVLHIGEAHIEYISYIYKN